MPDARATVGRRGGEGERVGVAERRPRPRGATAANTASGSLPGRVGRPASRDLQRERRVGRHRQRARAVDVEPAERRPRRSSRRCPCSTRARAARSGSPRRRRASRSRRAQRGVRRHAAADRERRARRRASTARSHLATSTSTTAAWKLAATSAPRRPRARRPTARTTAVFSPERLTSKPDVAQRAWEAERRRVAVGGQRGRSRGRRGSRARGTARPCRRPRRPRRRSSRRAARSDPRLALDDEQGVPARDEQRHDGERERRRARAARRPGGPRGGSRPTSGTPQAIGHRLGRRDPDEERADEPRAAGDGDGVEAGAVRVEARVVAGRASTTGPIASTWARPASSGTTPPKRSCRAIDETTTLERTLRSSVDHGRGGLVAARLDPEDAPPRHRRRGYAPSMAASRAAYDGVCTSRTHMTTASSPERG